MNFKNALDASYAIAELAEDVWHKRFYILKDDAPFFLSYRVSVSQYDPVDAHHDFYFHVVITRARWFYLVSDIRQRNITAKDIMRYEHDYRDTPDFDWNVRGESYRHYLFSDCFRPAIQRKIEEVQSTLENPGQPYLWNTFPVETLQAR